MRNGRFIKFLIIFALVLILFTATSVVLNVAGAIVGTILGILGLILKLIFSKSVLTLLVVGLIAYLILNRSDGEKRTVSRCDFDY